MVDKFALWVGQSRFFRRVEDAYSQLGFFDIIVVGFVLLFYASLKLPWIPNILTTTTWTILIVLHASLFVFFMAYTRNRMQRALMVMLVTLLFMVSHLENMNVLLLLSIFYAYIFMMIYDLISYYFKPKIPSLPEMVESTLVEFFKNILIILSGFVLALVFHYTRIHIGIYWILEGLASIFGISLVVFMITLLWSKGHHGVNVLDRVVKIFHLQMIMTNITMYLNTQTIPYIGSGLFFNWVVWIGGSGTTLGLAFLLRYVSRSEDYKTTGQEALKLSLFNINERIIFGLPLVENKNYQIPFFMVPQVISWLAYYIFYKGWVRLPLLPITWIAPNPIGLYFSTLLDIKSILLSLGLIVVSGLLYLPFMLKEDKAKLH